MKRVLVACLLAGPLLAGAAEPFAPTPAELAMLPAFCADRLQKGSSGKGVASAEQLGRANYLHIHHYCFAVNFVNRARRTVARKDRLYELGRAKSNYEYVVKATEPRFWMRPQIYVELGKVHVQLKETADASRLFNEAIAFNPAYEPAYLALIDLIRDGGRGKDAMEVATAGLRHIPGSAPLKKLYLELGGKEPFPEPIAKAAPPAEAAPPEAPPPPSPEAAPGGEKQAASTEAKAPGEAALLPDGARAPESPAAGEPVPTSGCRFCPPDEVQRRWRESFGGGKEQSAQ